MASFAARMRAWEAAAESSAGGSGSDTAGSSSVPKPVRPKSAGVGGASASAAGRARERAPRATASASAAGVGRSVLLSAARASADATPSPISPTPAARARAQGKDEKSGVKVKLSGPVGAGSALDYARRGGGNARRYAEEDGDSKGWGGSTRAVRKKVFRKTDEELNGVSDEDEVVAGDDIDAHLDDAGGGLEDLRVSEDSPGEGNTAQGWREQNGRNSYRSESSDGRSSGGEYDEEEGGSYGDGDDGDDDSVAAAGFRQRARGGSTNGGSVSSSDSDREFGSDGETLVRQNSNFSRLSAQSWLTVDSAESFGIGEEASVVRKPDEEPTREPEVALQRRNRVTAAAAAAEAQAVTAAAGERLGESSSAPPPPINQSSASSSQASPKMGKVEKAVLVPEYPELPLNERSSRPSVLSVPTHMDVRQMGRPTGGLMDVMDLVRSKTTLEKTVLECAIELLASTPAYKKKAWRRFGVRRVWLSADCEKLCWTSKKDGVQSDHMRLSAVVRLRCVEREVSIDVSEGHRISLLFANAEEANMWTRCLSCLIPLQSRVRAPPMVVPSDKEKEVFSLVDDFFNGRGLHSYGSVNSYVVLGPVRGHNGEARLVLSRADKTFFGMRYISEHESSFVLRSHEEIAVLKRLQHPNLVRHFECLADANRGGKYMIFEHTPRGVVTETERLEGVAGIPERTARIIMRDILSALEYLHALRIVHADLRPDNLLRAVNGSVKVNPLGCITQDFTDIRDMSRLVKARLGTSSPAFLPPELCWFGDSPAIPRKSYAMDSWAVGAVLYFLLYGRVPFSGSTSKEIQENICSAKLKFPRMPETSKKVRNLLKGVLGEKDPKTRIALSELKLHPWFAEGMEEEQGYLSQAPQHVRLVVSKEEVAGAVAEAKVRAPPPGGGSDSNARLSR